MEVKEHSIYEEVTTTMADLQPGDKVLCADGRWHEVEALPVHVPDKMFAITFIKNGVEAKVKCSGTHLWTLYNTVGQSVTLETTAIYEQLQWLETFTVGENLSGIYIKDVKRIKPEPVRCLHIKGLVNEGSPDDLLFEVVAEGKNGKSFTVLTHNCMERLICGQLGSVASRMALDDNQATTIDGKHKGAGMIKAQGIVSNVQYYFEQQKWLNKWFTDRGMTESGWDPKEVGSESPESIDLGEDEDLSIDENQTVIEFNGTERIVDNNKDQRFEEI